MPDNDKPTTNNIKVVQKEGISAVWLVPVIALIFGGWLLFKAISEQGVFITVQFDSASGITVDKTQVRYKGLKVGMVKKVEVTDDLQHVIASIEMIPSATSMLNTETLFWYVTADISFEGVKGLDTLLSGSYINIQPGIGEDVDSEREFVALNERPDIDSTTPGLHVVVQTSTLGSLGKNSPVTFKQIPVGRVEGYRYNDDDDIVDVNLFINPEYSHLVRENSRFWNASGIKVTAGLNTGVDIQTDSLASIIAGGIAFDNSEYDVMLEPAQNGQKYPLYANFQAAEMGHTIELELDWNSGIDRNAALMYQGLTIGRIEKFTKIDPEQRKILASVKVNPRVIPYLTESTEFFVVTPQLDLGGTTNLHALLTGSHISVRFSLEGEQKSSFKVYNQKPPYPYSEPGLHLVLTAEDITSINVGTGIFYNNLQVGSVQAIEHPAPNYSLIHLFVKPEYEKFVSRSSRFWQASGIKIKGGLQNFEIQTQSLQTMLKGGIAFDAGYQDKQAASDGDRFRLFQDKTQAKQRQQVTFDLHVKADVDVGTRILFQGEEIGSVHQLMKGENKLRAIAGIYPNFASILREGTQFWLVESQLSLAGVADTDALFGGAYISVATHKNSETPAKEHFKVANVPPQKPLSAEGLQLTLYANSGNEAVVGGAITYRGMKVGQIDHIHLDKEKDKVAIGITIDDEYRTLMNATTRFYSASGITVTGGLSDLTVKTESIDAILKGGISFLTPQQSDSDTDGALTIEEGDSFTLFDNVSAAENAGAIVTVYFNDMTGLKEGMPVQYQQQTVGVLHKLALNIEQHGATAIIHLDDIGRKFAVEGSQFWLAKTEIGLVGNKHLENVLTGGYIGVLPGAGEASTQFTANNYEPAVKALPHGLNVKLQASSLGSVRVGNPVLYRQVKVGEVIGVDLAETADKVNVYINVAARYSALIKPQTKFWNTSGFTLDAGLFSGVQLDVQSIETVLAGGIAFATPEADADSSADSEEGSSTSSGAYILHDQPEADWLQWQPAILLQE